MELYITIGIVAVLGYVVWRNWPKPASADMTDAAATSDMVAKVTEEIKETADVNKDGKVDVADAVEAVKKTVKKATSKKSKKSK